jgi:hypothetical protein
MAYSVNAAPAGVTAPSTSDSLKIFGTPTLGRQGYSICNPTASIIYVQERKAGGATPTAAAVVATPSYTIQPGGNASPEASADVDVFVAVASGTALIDVQELL